MTIVIRTSANAISIHCVCIAMPYSVWPIHTLSLNMLRACTGSVCAYRVVR